MSGGKGIIKDFSWKRHQIKSQLLEKERGGNKSYICEAAATKTPLPQKEINLKSFFLGWRKRAFLAIVRSTAFHSNRENTFFLFRFSICLHSEISSIRSSTATHAQEEMFWKKKKTEEACIQLTVAGLFWPSNLACSNSFIWLIVSNLV